MDLGNYNLGASSYSYKQADPANSKLKGLMTTDYDQFRKDLQTPGDININEAFDRADYTIRDQTGGQGLYGSSISSDAITNNTAKRANALTSNAAQAGATTAQLKSNENQWVGNASLDEARMENTWNLTQDQTNKALIHDILLGTLGNDWTKEQLKLQGQLGLNVQSAANSASDRSALWGGLGSIAGGLLNNWDSIFG
jgi:hypothetical protein